MLVLVRLEDELNGQLHVELFARAKTRCAVEIADAPRHTSTPLAVTVAL
jgi:hypothetical protein